MLSLLQASRFFAAAIVVFDHATVTFGMPRYYHYTLFEGLFGAGRYGVDFFFVLSGFIICYAHWDDLAPGLPDARRRLARFAQRRFLRIYPTYWLVLLLTLVPLYFTSSRYDAIIRSPWYLLNVVTLFQGNGNVLTSAWTLTHEMAFYVLFGVVIMRRNLGFVLLAAWFVLAALSFTVTIPRATFSHPEHIGFLAGMLGCYLTKTARIPAPRALFGLGLAGFLSCMVLAGYFHTAGDINTILTDPASRGPLLPLVFCSLLMIVGLVEMERSQAIRAPAVLCRLGDASYALYLLHFPILVELVKLFHTTRLERYVPVWALFFTAVAVAIVVSLAFHRLLEKPLLAMINRAVRKPRPASKTLASKTLASKTLAPETLAPETLAAPAAPR